MPRKTRSSKVLEKAEQRSAGLKAIGLGLTLSGSRTLSEFTTAIDELRIKQIAYNINLAIVNSAQTELVELEKSLATLSSQILLDIASHYGQDSREYEMAGGVRKSERARRQAKGRIKTGAEAQTS
ncbi:hypothetical protein [Leptolyngbya sp. FACHB-261]|uniref:hypothetical protein n=1 Tax=Leptolyngbya sp. FACHB-261 TaxID=2692806 RepID=UPI001683348B|nr:hypothetical protein [Leptolyngbya sp. FACHB-261]MBD2103077.1 hypothetical protein [Leptolyngbya sp. FACHB-261]